jgi:hypothetical protein
VSNSNSNGTPDPNTVHKIFDPNSKRWREARDFRHATYDDDGTYGTSQFVEFTVVGTRHEWPLFMTREQFEMYNSDVPVGNARKE